MLLGRRVRVRARPGVIETEVGYAGGHTENPTYRDVCSHGTGHAEVLRVEFDLGGELRAAARGVLGDARPDPGEPPGTGRRRSVPERDLHQLDEQQRGRGLRDAAQARFDWPIATEITPAGPFYPAEDYHQRYYDKNGHEPYCHVIPWATPREPWPSRRQALSWIPQLAGSARARSALAANTKSASCSPSILCVHTVSRTFPHAR